MANKPLPAPLPADLPEDWTSGQIVAPAGADVGLSEQHGYNYLMAQVNAAQRAANTINEGFDDISGKRTCRFVIGTSTAGWTQADCDYLCDGTDDQAEFSEAFDALMELGGGELTVLSGEYHLTSVNFSFYSEETGNMAILGEPGATIFHLADDVYFSGYNQKRSCYLWGLTFQAAGSAPYLSALGVGMEIRNCTFQNVRVSYGDGIDLPCNFRFEDNLVEADSQEIISSFNTAALVYASANEPNPLGSIRISGNLFRIQAQGVTSSSKVINVDTASPAVLVGNTVACSAENWQIYCRGRVTLADNVVNGVSLLTESAIVMTGNAFLNGSIVMHVFVQTGSSPAVAIAVMTGNRLTDTPVNAYGPLKISGNTFKNADGATALRIRKDANNAVSNLSPIVVGNYFAGGSVGVHLANSESATIDPAVSHALISSNRIFGCATAIQIDSSWSSCMVTDNLFDGDVVDNGTGNIVRLNSDDPGGGGGGSAGVASFNGRTGIVTPKTGDYTAAMVGARPDTWMPNAADVGAVPADEVTSIQALTQAEYDALAVKNAATLYLIEG